MSRPRAPVARPRRAGERPPRALPRRRSRAAREDAVDAEDATSWFTRARRFVARVPGWLRVQLIELVETQPAAVALAVYGFLRAMGVTVRSGQQGLMFSFGRATRVLEPGFHLMVPFLQKARVVANRSRTLDLEDQQVATADGLVYRVHATLVWRIVDVRRALVEVDDLVTGMGNALATSVWRVLEGRDRAGVRGREDLDDELAARMQARLEPWGVVVERAGFQSIAPEGPTLELLQLGERVRERERVARILAAAAEPAPGPTARAGWATSVALLGTPRFPVRRQLRATWRGAEARAARGRRRRARREAEGV